MKVSHLFFCWVESSSTGISTFSSSSSFTGQWIYIVDNVNITPINLFPVLILINWSKKKDSVDMYNSFHGKYIPSLLSSCTWRLSTTMTSSFNCSGCFWVFGGLFKDLGLALLVSLHLDNHLTELNSLLTKVWKNN